jgi:hypothetical protein
MHGAGENETVQRSHIERRIHMPAAPIQRIKDPSPVADDDLAAV